MTDGVTASLRVNLTATDLKSAVPFAPASQQTNPNYLLQLAAGTGIGNADTIVTKAINIAASGSVTYDLNGSLTDALGGTVNFADVQLVMLIADETNTNDIILGNGAADPWVGPFDAGSDTVAVHPGGILLFADPKGWPVIAATGDLLKLANSAAGSAVTGKLVLIGRSA